jgi:hypothetical protein
VISWLGRDRGGEDGELPADRLGDIEVEGLSGGTRRRSRHERWPHAAGPRMRSTAPVPASEEFRAWRTAPNSPSSPVEVRLSWKRGGCRREKSRGNSRAAASPSVRITWPPDRGPIEVRTRRISAVTAALEGKPGQAKFTRRSVSCIPSTTVHVPFSTRDRLPRRIQPMHGREPRHRRGRSGLGFPPRASSPQGRSPAW